MSMQVNVCKEISKLFCIQLPCPVEVGQKASGKTDLGKILQEIAWQSQRPIREVRVALLSTGWRQFNFSGTPLLQSRLENGGASSLPMLLPTFLINAPESMQYLTDIAHIPSIPSKEGQAQTRKEQRLLAQFSFGSALKMEYQAEHYFPADFLCRVIKS